MKRKLFYVLITAILMLSLTACGKEGTADTTVDGGEKDAVLETQEAVKDAEEITQDAAQEKEPQGEPEAAETEKPDAPEPEAAETETPASPEPELRYEDNFSVDSEAAAAFAGKIKEAVANQDLEALADLTSYPIYIGFEDGGVSVTSREELIALGAEKIFTSEMMTSIENAEESGLSPSMAGFVLSAEGRPNIVFGVVDGKLAIRGMNY